MRQIISPAFRRRSARSVLLPIYLAFLGVPKPPAAVTAVYTLVIGFLMVSRLPVFSGKTVRMRVPPEMVLPVNPETAMISPFPGVAAVPRVRVRLVPVVDPEVSWTKKVTAYRQARN